MGVDIVVGSHPHVVQGFEKYKNRFIFYSLGNFFFPDTYYRNKKVDFRKKTREYGIPFEGLVVKLVIDNSFDNVKYEFFKVEYKTDNDGFYSIELNNFDENFTVFWQKINEPLMLDNKDYIIFFTKKRLLRKKCLPIFKGNNIDIFRLLLFRFREIVIRFRNKIRKFKSQV